ncbi:AAA family ATPase [Kineosporia succinea]|uniref:Kinase n=1 Tax=Kineosporia succinea TaxID=84632 RepID=A0ABT9PDB3_9ACTN|nr:AAA family ATPase [Kineosporia succinea]MDP9830713.1 putative kinase [Kineosporia succinea]
MPRLILLNGAPGSGKSTLARRYADEHPMTLALDIDTVRGLLGGWLERPTESGLAARELALAMIRGHLRAGHDVVVPQYLGRIDFALRLAEAAGEAGTGFVEVALVSDVEEAVARFGRRSRQPVTAEHRDAAALQARTGGEEELRLMYQRLLDVIAQRPGTRTVRSVEGEIDQTYGRFTEALGPALA